MPKGIVFQPQASNPIPSGENGLWVNTSNQIVYIDENNNTQNISIGASGKGVYIPVKNNSGSPIAKGSVVSINSSGELQLLDVSVAANAEKVVGIASDSISNGATGLICMSGVVENLTTSLVFGDQVFASATPGGLYGSDPVIGVDGFVSGDYVVRLGVIYQNAASPGQKDIAVNIHIVGTL